MPAAAMDVTLPPVHPQQAGRRPGGDQRSRPDFRPGRGGKRPAAGLLILLAVTVVGAGSWLFREPIREAFQGGSSDEETDVVAEANPIKSTIPATAETERPTPAGATNPGRFDPSEPTDGAEKRDDHNLSSYPSTPPQAGAAKSSLGGLMEVPSKPVEAGIKSSPSNPAEVGNRQVKLEGVPLEAMPAAGALIKFLNAQNVEERMRYTLAPETMRDMMERYYSVNPAGPISVDTIGFVRFDAKPEMGNGAHAIFGVESQAWRYPVLVMMEETTDGFRVDWLSFVEFKDRILERFFTEYSEGPACFHIGLTRTHYFGGGVPNSDKKYAFTVTSAPPNPFSATVFVDMESALGKELKEKISWGSQVWAIAELEWMKLGTHQWVELATVPQLNWYSVPGKATSKVTQPERSPSTPTQIQRAVPIGR